MSFGICRRRNGKGSPRCWVILEVVKMVSRRQAGANRRNAQVSTGPKTPAGKAVSRWNALRHGLRAEAVLLPDEESDEHRAFVEALVGELRPAGEMEAVLVDRIVTSAWRLRRVARVEAGLFVRNHYDLLVERGEEKARSFERDELNEFAASINPTTITDEKAHAQALQEAGKAELMRDSDANATGAAFAHDEADVLTKLTRYETSLERSLYKALHELQRLQAARAGGMVVAPVAMDVSVDASHDVA